MNSVLVKFLFYVTIIVSPLLFFTDLTRNPYYFQIIFAQSMFVLLWLIVILYQKGKILHKPNPAELPMIVFYIFALLTFIISLLFLEHNYLIPELIEDSIKVYGKNFFKYSIFNEGFKKLIFTVTNILLVYFFATNFVSKKNFKYIYYTFFVVGLVASVYGILQYFGIELIWPKALNPFGGRCVSTFGNPNFLSSFLILLFPIMFAYFLAGENSGFMFISMVTYFCALMATLTRSSWAGLAGSMIFFVVTLFFLQRDLLVQKIKNILIILLVLCAIYFFWPGSSTTPELTPVKRVTETVGIIKPETIYSPLHQRVLIWLCGFDMVKEKFFTGKGWGLFELFYPFYQGKYLFVKKLSHRTHANNAHNEVIEVWSQTGTIGLGLYILFFVSLFIYGIKLANFIPERKNKLLVIALVSSVLGMLVDNMLNVTIHFCIPAMLFFFNIGAIAGFDDTRKEKVINLSRPMIIVLCLLGGFIVYRLVFNFIGEINYFKGFKYSKQGILDPALKYLSLANKYQKYEVNNNYELANTYARIRKHNEAIHYYYEALASNCGYDEIHFNLATVYSQIGNLDIAKLHYSQALFINPISKEAYMALGSIMLTDIDRNLGSAIKLFEQATVCFPNEKDFFNNLGYLHMRSGEEKKALDYYYKALQIDPNFDFAKRNYMMLAQKLNLKNDPIKKYEQLLFELNNKISHNAFEDAEKICNSILEIFPNDSLTKFYLANIYLSQGKIDKAINIYTELISLNSENLNARYNLALAYVQQKNFRLAKEHLEYILSRDPTNVQVQKQLELVNNMLMRY